MIATPTPRGQPIYRRQSNERLVRVEQLTNSNALSIQALGDRIAEVTHEIDDLRDMVMQDHQQAREERQELRQATLGIANLLASLDEDRPTILMRLNH